MLGVKITALVCVITVVWSILVKCYLDGNRKRAFEISITQNYPWWLEMCAWLIVISLFGVVYSVFYLLFLR